MHWKELRGFYFPLCMEEISKVKTRYLSLIQQIQKTNQDKDKKAFLELKKSIELRIIEIDKFIEENFDKQYVLHFEKCKIKLKKLLSINPNEKLSKHNLNKNFHDIDSLNKVLKKQQEKEKETQKEKMKDEPIYNHLPVDYGLYEGLIEEMKMEDLKHKNYLNPNKKYLGEVLISSSSESQDNSFSNNKNNTNNNKHLRITFGNSSNNYFKNSSEPNNFKNSSEPNNSKKSSEPNNFKNKSKK